MELLSRTLLLVLVLVLQHPLPSGNGAASVEGAADEDAGCTMILPSYASPTPPPAPPLLPHHQRDQLPRLRQARRAHYCCCLVVRPTQDRVL